MKTPRTPSEHPDRVPSDELKLHVNWVRRVANALVRDSDAADDIAQETLVVALNRGPSGGGAVRPWLGGVLRNVFLHYQRARGRRRSYESAVELDSDVPTPGDLLETVQLQRALVEMLEELSEPIRTTLMLRYYHDMTSAEIARKLGVPGSTVRSRLALGLDVLRKRLDEVHKGDREAWKRMLLPLAAMPPAPLAAPLGAGALYAGAAALLVALVLYPQASSWLTARGAHQQDDGRVAGASVGESRAALTSRAGAPTAAEARRGTQLGGGVDVAGMLSGPEIAGPQRWAMEACGGLGPEVGGERPRLLVTPRRLCQLRAARSGAEGPLREILDSLKARVDSRQPHLFSVEHLSYARAHEAQAAAFTFLLTGDRRYALQAYEAVEAIYRDSNQDFTPHNGHGLARARTGLGLAFTYDWAYHGLDDGQRAQLARWLEGALDGWTTFQHANLMGDESSYWVALCRGTEMVQMLALGAERARAGRFAQLRASLKAHVGNAYGSMGMAEEGIAHVARGGLHLLLAAYALRSVGFEDLETAVRARAFWKLAMFTGSSALTKAMPRRAHVLQSGISPRVTEEAGWASLLFRTVPSEHLGHYRHFYDRHLGRASTRSRGERFDSDAAGWIWSALYLPESIAAQEPDRVLGRVAADPEHGAYFFRRSWSELSDVQVMVLGDHRSHGRGWDIDEAFGLGILAHGVAFAGGGGPSVKRRWASGLFVDGEPYSQRGDTGATDVYEPGPDGGYVIVDGGVKYKRLGLHSSKRHVLVDLGRGEAPTIISTWDVLRAAHAHDYLWQLKPGDHTKDDGIVVARAQEAGRESFTMTAPNGAYLKGWVMHPPNASVVPGDPLKVQLRSADADLWVVMAVGKGPPPIASSHGQTLAEGRIQIADAEVHLDSAVARIVIDRR